MENLNVLIILMKEMINAASKIIGTITIKDVAAKIINGNALILSAS